MIQYTYDAYGNINSISGTLASTLGIDNPFRYKGYYYDEETKLYYCKSRYYNPEWGRWISPDSIDYLVPESINVLNLYCYCGNNPVGTRINREEIVNSSISITNISNRVINEYVITSIPIITNDNFEIIKSLPIHNPDKTSNNIFQSGCFNTFSFQGPQITESGITLISASYSFFNLPIALNERVNSEISMIQVSTNIYLDFKKNFVLI